MTVPSTANESYPQARGHDLKLTYGAGVNDNIYLRAAPNPGEPILQSTVEPVRRSAVDTRDNPEDVSGRSGDFFSRSSFLGGEGLDKAHQRGGGDEDWQRFWSADGIVPTPDVPGEPSILRLAHPIASIFSESVTGSPLGYFINDNGVLVTVTEDSGNKEVLLRITDPLGTPSTAEDDCQTVDAANETIGGLVKLGADIYVDLIGHGIHKKDSAGTWTHWSATSAANGLWVAKRRVIGAAASSGGTSVLNKYDSSGTATALLSLTATLWDEVIDHPAAIIANGWEDQDSVMYVFTDEAGTLTLQAETRIMGERLTGGVAAYGRLVYGTFIAGASGQSKLYVADLNPTSYAIENVQVLRTWDHDNSFSIINSIVAHRDSVYVLMRNIPDQTVTIWRLYLPTMGLWQHASLDHGSTLTGGIPKLQMLDGRSFYKLSAGDVYREDSSTYVSTGYLISPLADHFTADTKQLVGAAVDLKAVPTSTQVTIHVTTDESAITDDAHASWVLAGTFTDTTASGVEQLIQNSQGRYVAAKLTLTPDGGATNTPEVRGFTLHTIYGGGRENLWRIPIDLSDQITRPFRKKMRAPGRGNAVLSALRTNAEGKNVIVDVFRGTGTITGTLERVAGEIPGLPLHGGVYRRGFLEIRGVLS